MIRLLPLLTFLLLPIFIWAQATLSGQIIDANSQRAVAYADIKLTNSEFKCQSTIVGDFTLQVLRKGRYTLTVNKRGYEPETLELRIHPGRAPVIIHLKPKLLGRQVWEAWSPSPEIVPTTIVDTIVDQQLGNQDLPDIFRQLPGAYISRQGGGWGDSRLQLHGFNQQEVAYTLNGIPLNDPENGQFFWSRWSVLRHLEPTMRYQAGNGQSILTNTAIGGELQMLSRGVEVAPQKRFTLSRGNDNFQSYRLNWQRGIGWSEWGVTAMFAHDRGNGYIDGTDFQAYSYFLSLEKKLGKKHRMTVTALGSSQWHHQRTLAGNLDQITLRTFVDPDNTDDFNGLGTRYNHEWGLKEGEQFSARRDFYSQPLYSMNHLWQIKPKLSIHTLAYGSHGRGGNTGLRGRIRNGGSSFGDSFSGPGVGIYDTLGQIRFDEIIAYNGGRQIDDFGDAKIPDTDDQYIVSRNGFIDNTPAGSGFVRRASINNFDQYGVASRLTYLNKKGLKLSAGVDYRQFRSQHFRRLDDLLGADGYLSQGNINDPNNLITAVTPANFGDFGTDARATSTNVLNYNYSGEIRTLGLLADIEYQIKKWTFRGQLNRGNQRLSRIDYFNYTPDDTPDNDLNNDEEYQQSPTQEYSYHNYQTGFTYQLSKRQTISGQFGRVKRAPFFDEIFEGNRNRINPNPGNQQGQNWQLQYALRKPAWAVQLQIYQQNWSGQIAIRGLSNYAYEYQGDTLRVSALARFDDLEQRHQGINLAFTFGLDRSVQFSTRVGLGDWHFPNNQTGTVTDLNNDRIAGKTTAETAELPIGGGAQTTLAFGLQWEVRPGLYLNANYFYFDRLYAPWQLSQELPTEVLQLPDYGLLDLGLRYNFLIGRRLHTTLFTQFNNLLDETYVAEVSTQIADNPNTADRNEFYDNRGIFGFGRTWNAGLSISF